MTTVPMSLRRKSSEARYQQAKIDKALVPLNREYVLTTWKHWKLVRNRFPYDIAYKEHDMLLPIRENVSDRWHLNDDEKEEFEEILRNYVYRHYDLWFENCPKRRSVLAIYHVHVATYVDDREELHL